MHDATRPSRNALALSPIPPHFHLVELAVFQGVFGQFQFPVSRFGDAFRLVLRRFLPVVEVADEIDFRRIRRPLAENPALSRLVQTEIEVAGSKFTERGLALARQLVDFPLCVVVATLDCLLERLQIRVVPNNSDMILNAFLSHFLTFFIVSQEHLIIIILYGFHLENCLANRRFVGDERRMTVLRKENRKHPGLTGNVTLRHGLGNDGIVVFFVEIDGRKISHGNVAVSLAAAERNLDVNHFPMKLDDSLFARFSFRLLNVHKNLVALDFVNPSRQRAHIVFGEKVRHFLEKQIQRAIFFKIF